MSNLNPDYVLALEGAIEEIERRCRNCAVCPFCQCAGGVHGPDVMHMGHDCPMPRLLRMINERPGEIRIVLRST